MTDQEVIEMTDEEFEDCEKEFFDTFGADALQAESSSEDRMESILKRTKLESVMKDSTDFIVESFGRGLLGITDALVGVTEKKPKPRRRSF